MDAINRADADAVVAMFPAPGSTAVVRQPELEFTTVPPFPPGDLHAATTPDELRALVIATAGYRLAWTDSLKGTAKRLDYVTPASSVWVWQSSTSGRYQATGPKGTFRGSSKIAVNCNTGKFIVAAL